MRSATPQAADTIEGLIEQLKNRDYKVSKAAAERLIELNDPASIPLLVEVLKGDYVCNCQAAGILLEIRGAEAIPDVLEAMANPPWWDDQDGMCAVVGDYLQMTGTATIPALISALQDPNPKIRQTATWGLGYTQDARAVPALIAASHDSDLNTQMSAEAALINFADEPELREVILMPLPAEERAAMKEVITWREAFKKQMDDRERIRHRDSIIIPAITVLILMIVFAVFILGKVH